MKAGISRWMLGEGFVEFTNELEIGITYKNEFNRNFKNELNIVFSMRTICVFFLQLFRGKASPLFLIFVLASNLIAKTSD